MSEFVRMVRDERGATAVEYGLIATFVSIAAIYGMSAMGVSLADMFTLVAKVLANALTSAGLN